MLVTERDLGRQLIQRFEASDYSPPKLPSVAVRLMELSRDPNVEISKVVKVLEQDQMIAGRVLKLANSAIYRGKQPVGSVNQAVLRLGLKTLRDMVLQIAMEMRVFRASGYTEIMESLRRHSLATAHVARRLGQGHDWAFLAGLVHDVGVAASLALLSDVPRGEEIPNIGEVWHAIEGIHAMAGASICRSWGVPDIIPMAVMCHHSDRGDMPNSRLPAIVRLAEHIATHCGYAIRPSSRSHPLAVLVEVDSSSAPALASAREVLGMDSLTYRNGLKRMQAELETLFDDE